MAMTTGESPNRFFVFLHVLCGDDDPAIVTTALGIRPTESERVEGPLLKGQGLVRQGFWVLNSGLSDSDSIELQLAALVDKLEPYRAGLAQVVVRYKSCIWIAAYFYETTPQFTLSPALLARVGALGVELYFDCYCLGDTGKSSIPDDAGESDNLIATRPRHPQRTTTACILH